MKRLIVTIQDEDLVKVLSVIVKTGADFNVQHVGEVEEPAVRHIQRRTADGKSCRDVFLETVIERKRVTRAEMSNVFAEKGFGKSTIYGTASELKNAGLIKQDGDYYKAA